MAIARTYPRIGAHVPTSGGMATRSIEYALTIKAEVIQVLGNINTKSCDGCGI